MKKQLKNFLSFFNKIWVLANLKNGSIKGTHLYFTKFKIEKGSNTVKIINSSIEKTQIDLIGKNNCIECDDDCYIARSEIFIAGENNKLILKNGVKLRGANVNITGYNCEVVIGDNTTFGGVRIVNVGSHNVVTIGADCLFSDGIEIWASDTHPILNDGGEVINYEKPITIGNKVWVGTKVIILKGVTINDGSIIGMGSVVTKDVPAGVVSAGYPNKTIKENVSWKLDYPFRPLI